MLATVIFASLAVSLISFSGAMVLFWKKVHVDKMGAYLVSFAAGVMLTAAFVDLLPEALDGIGENDVFIPAFLGIILFFFLERFVLWFHHHHEAHGTYPANVLVLIGDGLHNFIDGVAIAATFLANPSLGFLTTLAIAAHEIPQEIADFSVLIHGGLSKAKALFFNFLSGMTAILGAIIGFYFLENLEGVTPLLLSFTAGMFIYIACSDLIPELHKEFEKSRKWLHFLPFVLGITLFWSLIRLLEG